MQVCTYEHLYVQMCIRTHIRAYMHAYVHTYTCACLSQFVPCVRFDNRCCEVRDEGQDSRLPRKSGNCKDTSED